MKKLLAAVAALAVLPWVLGALALALALAAWRLFRGPDLPDRILALDTLYIDALALLVALAVSMAAFLLLRLSGDPAIAIAGATAAPGSLTEAGPKASKCRSAIGTPHAATAGTSACIIAGGPHT